MKLGVLFSSGKDSCYSAYIMKSKGHELTCLITLISENKDSYMYHTPNIHLTKIQSKAMNVPLVIQNTKGEKESELEDLEKALKKAIKEYEIKGIITGALYSQYQKSRIEKIARKLKLKVFSPLWHMSQEKEMRNLLKNKFEIVLTSIAAEGLDKTWLNKKLTNKHIDELVKLSKKNGLNVAGEGGEFESLVLNCPLFERKIKIVDSETREENKNTAKLIIKKVKLVS